MSSTRASPDDVSVDVVSPDPAAPAARLPYSETCPEGWRSTRKLCILAFVLSITGQWASCLALPAIYNRLAESLGFTPAQLGLLHSMRLFSMFGTLPLHAYASQFADRGKLMGGSLVVGGLFTILQILGTSYGTFMFINILSGASLGMVVPVTRSLIPNYYRLEDRGGAFGILEVAGGIGGFFGAALGVIVTTYTQPFGYVREIYDGSLAAANAAANASSQLTWDMWVTDQLAFSNATAAVAANFQDEEGISICCVPWQTNFIVLGIVTILLGIMVTMLVRDPVRDTKVHSALGKDITKVFEGLELDELTGRVNDDTIRLVDMKRVCRSRTWLFIAVQGVWGCFPWSSFSFLILWFERMEIQSMLAVVIFACVGGMAAAGGAVGGSVGDYFTKKSLWHFKYSRLLINYASVIMGIPGALIYFLALPYYTWWSYALFSLWFGFSVAWCPGNNAAIMSDLFPQNLHPLVFAMQFWVEGASSAFGPFLCALINDEVFKAKDLSLPQADFNALPASRRTELLNGLGMSLLTVCCVGWSMCLLTYSPTWFSYPKESRHIARIEGRPDPSWYGLRALGSADIELPATSLVKGGRVVTPLGGGVIVEERDAGVLVVKLDWKLANGSRATLYTVKTNVNLEEARV